MKHRIRRIIERTWWLIPLMVFDFFYLYFIQYMIEGRSESDQPVQIHFEGLAFLFFVSLFSIGCVSLSDKILTRIGPRNLPFKYLINIFLSFFIFILIVLSVQIGLESNSDSRPLSYFLNNSILFLFLHLIVGNAAIAISYFRNSLKLSERLLLLEKTKAEQELTILQQQMNPHFLFNNLNTLTSLIPEDPGRAIDFTRRLSSIFRHATDHTDQDLIRIEDEINFLRDYVDLLSYRFGDSYQLDEKGLDSDVTGYLIIPMALQVVIENAVKHNIGRKTDPLIIQIKVQEDFLEITNEIRPKMDPPESRQGVGLRNLNQQFELVTGRTITIKTENNYFSVSLPLIKEIRDEDIDH